eukprot:425001-Prorocentrum_lima.AAC.1
MFHILKNNNNCLRCHHLKLLQVNQLPGQNREVIKPLHHNNHGGPQQPTEGLEVIPPGLQQG